MNMRHMEVSWKFSHTLLVTTVYFFKEKVFHYWKLRIWKNVTLVPFLKNLAQLIVFFKTLVEILRDLQLLSPCFNNLGFLLKLWKISTKLVSLVFEFFSPLQVYWYDSELTGYLCTFYRCQDYVSEASSNRFFFILKVIEHFLGAS